MTQTTTQVDAQSAAVAKMAEPWPMIDALVGGTGAMRAAGKAFLPQFPKEDDGAYKARLSTATLFPAFTRTAETMAAKPLSKAIEVDDVPEQIAELFEDVDGEGSTLHAFAASRMLECLEYGLCGVLVDVPPADGVRTMADEKAAGIRPYFAAYKAPSILGWRTDGKKLIQLRLLEMVTEPDGEFGEKCIKQVRVLTPGAWEVWRVTKDERTGKEDWSVYAEGTTSLQTVPFVFFYGLREGFGCGKSPLLDLAYLNVKHWQSQSDQDNILHVSRVPILYALGFEAKDSLTIGGNTFVQSSNAEAKIGFAEHSGAAIGAGRDSLKDLEDQMRQTGAELLVQRPNIATATQTVSEGEGNKSILQRIVENFEESLEACINLMGEWMNVPCACEVKMFKDFGAFNLSDASVNSILAAVTGLIISKQTAFEEFKRRGLVSPEASWEEEYKRIAEEAGGNAEPEEPEDEPPEKPKDEAEEEDGLEIDND